LPSLSRLTPRPFVKAQTVRHPQPSWQRHVHVGGTGVRGLLRLQLPQLDPQLRRAVRGTRARPQPRHEPREQPGPGIRRQLMSHGQ
jgi:hypothetical protein